MEFTELHGFLSSEKCPSCHTPIEWGVNTMHDSECNCEVCTVCNATLKKD